MKAHRSGPFCSCEVRTRHLCNNEETHQHVVPIDMSSWICVYSPFENFILMEMEWLVRRIRSPACVGITPCCLPFACVNSRLCWSGLAVVAKIGPGDRTFAGDTREIHFENRSEIFYKNGTEKGENARIPSTTRRAEIADREARQGRVG